MYDNTDANIAEYKAGLGYDRWVPACCGHEVNCLINGEWWLYVWNDARMEHGWLHIASDIVYDEEREYPL